MNRSRLPVVLGALMLLGVGCAGDGEPPPTGPDQASVCCECACALDGVPCLNITIEGTEGDSCPQMCEAECSAHDECPSVGAIATCSLLPPDDPNTIPGPGCSELLDDELDECEQDDTGQQL